MFIDSSDDPERQDGMMVSFRLAGSEDAKKLAEIRCMSWRSAYRGIYPDEMLDYFDFAAHEKQFQKQMQNPKTEVYIVQNDGRDIGYVTLSRRDSYKDFGVCMDSLYLLPEVQGKGVGREIMKFVRKQCRKMGYSKFYHSCNPHNHRARAFYTAMGGQVGYRDDQNQDPAWDQWYYEYRLE